MTGVWSLHPCPSRGFFPRKPSACVWVQTKKTFVAEFKLICLAFSSFFSFLDKKIERVYFNQHFECTAPKCWSKYTTPTSLV